MFSNRVIVITGGTDGIGRSLTLLALEKGAAVATCGRSVEKLERIKSEAKGKNLLAAQCDVSVETDCEAFIKEVIAHFGRIDILINNAGISMRSMFNDVSVETMRQVMEINFWGAVYCTKYAMASIVQQKGTIAAISSIAGYRGLPGRSGYSASKFALNGWMEALRVELWDQGVNVMWVAPGFTQSNVRKTALTKDAVAQGTSPLNESKLMTADQCAEHILKAIDKRKRNTVLTLLGKQTVFMNKFFPGIADRLTKNFFFKGGKLIK